MKAVLFLIVGLIRDFTFDSSGSNIFTLEKRQSDNSYDIIYNYCIIWLCYLVLAFNLWGV